MSRTPSRKKPAPISSATAPPEPQVSSLAIPYAFWRGTRLAHAKVNLTLEVVGAMPDGYHVIRSIMVPVELADRVTMRVHYDEASAEGTEIALTVEPADPRVPSDDSNLVVRVAREVLEEWPADQARPRRLELLLEKVIPTEAGLGGGSADAAATLHLLDSLTRYSIARDTITAIAATQGADVPQAHFGSPVLCQGYGELLTPLEAEPLWLVLVRPDLAIPTPWCYRRFDELHLGADSRTRRDGLPPASPKEAEEGLIAALAQGDAEGVGAHLFNDLQSPVLDVHPHLATIISALTEAGCVGAQMTGSGSCFFGVAPSEAVARAAAAAVEAAGLGVTWVTRTLGSI